MPAWDIRTQSQTIITWEHTHRASNKYLGTGEIKTAGSNFPHTRESDDSIKHGNKNKLKKQATKTYSPYARSYLGLQQQRVAGDEVGDVTGHVTLPQAVPQPLGQGISMESEVTVHMV